MIEMRAELIEIANRAGRESRIAGAPVLVADAAVETLIAWLAWNDPNGAWPVCADGECGECPRCSPLTLDDAYAVLAEMLADDVPAAIGGR